MNKRAKNKLAMKQGTISQLLLLGISGILCAFILLGAGWVVSVAQLQEMKVRLFTDAHSLYHAQALEIAVLARDQDGQRHLSEVSGADHLITELRKGVTSPREKQLVETIAARY
jgi:hypothetical protein